MLAMLKRIAAIVGLLFIGAIVFIAAFVVTNAGGSVGCTLPNGREISASSNHLMLSMESGNNSATIKTGGHTIKVQSALILLDGIKVADVPVAAKAVDVQVQSGEVLLFADGVMVGPRNTVVK
jgi:hypothetical protein